MYCKYCGSELKGNEISCPYCGNTVSDLPSSTAAFEAQEPKQPEVAPEQPPVQQNATPQSGFCLRCGQKVVPGANVCTFCGQPVNTPYPSGQNGAVPPPYYTPQQAQAPVEKKGTGLGIGGIIGGLFIPILGIILGIIAINQGAKTKNKTAVVLGVIAIIIGVINWIINIALMMNDPSFFDPGTMY
ncbi:MAG: zinc ribbon domain-containing protein [Clostridia bacterium]|nr:zinc ribbon domain-containing protein [Clostridia bacterium]